MATTYRAAFGNLEHHKAVVQELCGKLGLPVPGPKPRPDTSGDSELAHRLAEDERRAAGYAVQRPDAHRTTSPSHVKVHVVGSSEAPNMHFNPLVPPGARHQRSYSDGSARLLQQQHLLQQQQQGSQPQEKLPQRHSLLMPDVRRSSGGGAAPPASAAPAALRPGQAPPAGAAGLGRPVGAFADARSQQVVSDAELAARLQQVEMAAVADATGKPQSLLFPDLQSQPSMRELALGRTLSRVPSVMMSPAMMMAAAAAAAAPPPEPVVSADRRRLQDTLRLYELTERQVAGDGNCQFRALSDQLYDNPEHHAEVRRAVVAVLRQRAAAYSCYVAGDYGAFVDSMARSGTWGDHLTLQAAADTFGVRIVVVTSYEHSPVITIEPEQKKSGRTLFLSFWAEVHYNSLYPAKEPPGPLPRPNAAAAAAKPAGPGNGGAAAGKDGVKPPKVLGSRKLGQLFNV
ncbi:hypothetical protein HXX76_008103 [Chlamydomonas incerta]|uniref:OTU domain-containing protein n=1 Tax=Chlamydomonas incerta TaxID=51695 RepID=A0A835T785_CHLIN|nr:hypothetical protein HXX76_008103 [Chlamydomonas incerta]|eukprot:KAG2433740.1 hypothetical protein HXX76_008103 [Chlamydomonas incerta]